MSKLNHDTIICNSIHFSVAWELCRRYRNAGRNVCFVCFICVWCSLVHNDTIRYDTGTKHTVCARFFMHERIYLDNLFTYLFIYFLPFSCTRACACVCVADLHTIIICMNIILIILHFIALTFRLNTLACIIIMVMGFEPLMHEFKRKM